MRTPVAVLFLAALAAPASAALSADARLVERDAANPGTVLAEVAGRPAPGWVTWSVPAPVGARSVCCFRRHWNERGCVLGASDHGWGSSSDDRPRFTDEVSVFLHVRDGGVDDLVLASPNCPVEARDAEVLALRGVDSDASARFFAGLARSTAAEEIAERAVAALAHHRTGEADALLAGLAGDGELETGLRRQALFWSGQLRGRAGVALAERTLDAERDREIIDAALFALAESGSPRAAERLAEATRSAADLETRSQALFWLSQAKGGRHAETIFAAAFEDRDVEVRERAVFALSQLDGGSAWLVRLLRESPDAGVRRQALFWLGQSDDPQALTELERILAP